MSGHQTETRASPALDIRRGLELAEVESGEDWDESEWVVEEEEPERNSQRMWRLWACILLTSSKVPSDQTISSPSWVPAKMYLSDTARARTELSCLSSWTRTGASDSSWVSEKPLVIGAVVGGGCGFGSEVMAPTRWEGATSVSTVEEADLECRMKEMAAALRAQSSREEARFEQGRPDHSRHHLWPDDDTAAGRGSRPTGHRVKPSKGLRVYTNGREGSAVGIKLRVRPGVRE